MGAANKRPIEGGPVSRGARSGSAPRADRASLGVAEGERANGRKTKAPALLIDGRYMPGWERVRVVRQSLAKRRARLLRSMAYGRATGREPRPADLERWAAMRLEIAGLEIVLAKLLAGESPAPSPRTGQRTRETPDAFG